MTPDKINIACAKLTGWEIAHEVGKPGSMMCGCTEEDSTPRRIPTYTACHNAAMELVEWMANKGWRVKLENGLDKTWECTFERTATTKTHPDDRTPNGLEQHYWPADSLPLAICLAFLKANNIDPDKL